MMKNTGQDDISVVITLREMSRSWRFILNKKILSLYNIERRLVLYWRKKMNNEEEMIVLYKDDPDENSGRCECGNNIFKSRVLDGKFYRKCQECGKTKIV
jgi:hypothetical protein